MDNTLLLRIAVNKLKDGVDESLVETFLLNHTHKEQVPTILEQALEQYNDWWVSQTKPIPIQKQQQEQSKDFVRYTEPFQKHQISLKLSPELYVLVKDKISKKVKIAIVEKWAKKDEQHLLKYRNKLFGHEGYYQDDKGVQGNNGVNE